MVPGRRVPYSVAMQRYLLKRCDPRVGEFGIRKVLGDQSFEAPDDAAAVAYARETYAEAIVESDYAAVRNAADMPIWESKPWHA